MLAPDGVLDILGGPSEQDDPLLELILQLVAEKHLVVPVVGEELLRLRLDGREMGLYNLLAERLAKKLAVPATDLPTTGALHEVACRYLDEHGELEEVYLALKLVMPRREEIPIPEPLLQLARFRPFQLYVTTTFDPLLVWALDEVRFGGQERTQVLASTPNNHPDLPCEASKLQMPIVYHLFGRLSAASDYAVTEEDTLEILHTLQDTSRQPKHLFDALTNDPLLLLGVSFPDWLARFLLRLGKRERLTHARDKTDLVADSRLCKDPGLVRFLQRFSSRTKVFHGGGAPEFVDALVSRWEARNPSGPLVPVEAAPRPRPAPAAQEPEPIFLSYASEDRDLVEQVKDALDAQGLDVWMDTSELHAGESWEEKILAAIDHCRLFVPFLSQNVLTSKRREFRVEWARAEKNAAKVLGGTKFIIPLTLDDISPDDVSLPSCFRGVQCLRAAGKTPAALAAALKEIYRESQKL